MNSKIKWLNDFSFMAFCGYGTVLFLLNYVREQWEALSEYIMHSGSQEISTVTNKLRTVVSDNVWN